MKHYLLASDFDQTLSLNDSGLVLSEMLGLPHFAEHRLLLQEWDKMRTDALLIRNVIVAGAALWSALDPARRPEPVRP